MVRKQKVSLIMPMYNHEKYIKKAIETVVNQSYKNLELIVIDDGSTDSSAIIVKKFNDKRIKYVFQKNKGVKKLNQTINKGLNFADGELITMVTSDDYWPLDRLEKQVDFFQNRRINMVFGNMTIIDENNQKIRYLKPSIPKNFNTINQREKVKKYFTNNYIPQPTTLIRTEALKKIGGYIQKNYMYAEDYPTQLNLMMNGDVFYIDHNLAFYRLHDNQMTNLHTEKMIFTDIKYLKNFYSSLKLNDKLKTGIKNKNELDCILDQKVKNLFFYLGYKNACLWKINKARAYFRKGQKKGNYLVKIQCLTGLILINLGINFNIIKKLRRYFSNFFTNIKYKCLIIAYCFWFV
jgi:glycosyltransferase involved in cell wall biosynthesis